MGKLTAPSAGDNSLKRRPTNWKQRRKSIHGWWKIPLVWIEWLAETLVFWLRRLAILELITILGGLSVVVAAWQYITGSDERATAKHYQAWQVINLAHGKGGSGGRVEALQDLVRDGVDLSGVDLSGAWLQKISIPGARLIYGKVDSADLRNANFANVVFGEVTGVKADFISANLRHAVISGGNFREALFAEATLCWAHLDGLDLQRANFSGANLMGVRMNGADLRGASLAEIHNWNAMGMMLLTNIYDVRHAPPGFAKFAIDSLGAVSLASRADWQRLIIDSSRTYSRRFTQRYRKTYELEDRARDQDCLDPRAMPDSLENYAPVDSEPQYVPDTTQVLPRIKQ